MRRREFITVLGGAAASWPLAAWAQQAERMRRIGVLTNRAETEPEGQRQLAALRGSLTALGWVAGRNVEIAFRWHAGDASRAHIFAQELVALRPDVLVAYTTPSLTALRQVARTIPIVFAGVADPVAQGFVQSLARPDGNLTGFGLEEPGLGAKWVELLKEIAPRVDHAAIIFNPETAPYARMFLPSMEAAARSAALTSTVVPIGSVSDIEQAVAAAGREQRGGLIVLPDSFLVSQQETVMASTVRHRVPAVYAIRPFAVAGGLIAYGIDRIELFRLAASYVDRVLKGEKPADLPVQLPTKFELIINLKTAKALGLEVPPMLLARADEVIE
jgi:putative tryptophan/tyrosine transport system substrate-binding protein